MVNIGSDGSPSSIPETRDQDMSRHRTTIRTTAPLTLLLGMLLALPAQAATSSTDFDALALGTIHGQAGWSSAGAATGSCALYDHAVVDNTYGYASFGAKSLRISNAVTSGCFGDQTFSPSVADGAGETGAAAGGMSGGTRQRRFEAQWDFASTVPGAEQPGASVVASPDRGDGARMAWIQMADAPGGLDVNFYDFQVPTEDITGTCANGEFVFTPIATGLDRTAPHTVRVVMDLFDGAGNDVVTVFVDGALVHTGTSWEDYFRECQGPDTRTVDSILFRTAGAAAPGTLGNGFLIDNLSVATSTDTTPPMITLARSPSPNSAGWNNSDVTLDWTVSDPETGIASASAGCTDQVISTESAGTTVTCTATNGHGFSATTAVTIRLDKTAPTTVADTYSGGDLRGSATDNLSGVAQVQVTWSSVGSITQNAVCYQGCPTVSAKWRATPPQPKPALYQAVARSTDVAGNVGAASPSQNVLAL